MYQLTIQNFPNNMVEVIYFNNIRAALDAMHERCDALGYQVTPDNEGNFIAGGIGHDWRIELNSNF